MIQTRPLRTPSVFPGSLFRSKQYSLDAVYHHTPTEEQLNCQWLIYGVAVLFDSLDSALVNPYIMLEKNISHYVFYEQDGRDIFRLIVLKELLLNNS